MQLASSTVSSKQGLSKKVIIGFAAIASAAVVGAVGMVGATSSDQNNNEARKAFCNRWQDHKYKNHGQCVSDWNDKHHGGHGYPKPNDKGHTVNTQVGINIKGNDIKGDDNDDNDNHNNIVVNVWNYFFGN